MERELIKGKVAKVLNDRELVINRGADHGVEEGMQFQIRDRSGALIDVPDPETGEVLGSLFRKTVKVRVVELNEVMAIGRTYVSFTKSEKPGSSAFAALTFGTPVKSTTYYQTLRRDRTYTTGGYADIDADECIVHVNDDAIEIPEEKDETGDKT